MDFRGLQENLRQLLLRRIRAGDLSGMQLARQAGLRQPHISNFLHCRRGLSLDALDRVLQVERLSVLDLLDAEELARHARILPPAEDEFENIILLKSDLLAAQPCLTFDQVADFLKVSKRFLRRLRPAMDGDRSHWQRFIFLRAGGREGHSMYPRLLPGACVLVDRHYNSLLPYHRDEHNMYAVLHEARRFLCYVEQHDSRLILRPENRAYPDHILPLAPGKSSADYIVGRICSIQIDT
ncbi:MAG TPA: LexA family transcriptional regulator [Terriglobales bacterium]|nr:LexA family transcriptional regulator [Terriglobales bacterium]